MANFQTIVSAHRCTFLLYASIIQIHTELFWVVTKGDVYRMCLVLLTRAGFLKLSAYHKECNMLTILNHIHNETCYFPLYVTNDSCTTDRLAMFQDCTTHFSLSCVQNFAPVTIKLMITNRVIHQQFFSIKYRN